MVKLRPQQRIFVNEYAKNGANGTQAAMKAYNLGSKTKNPANKDYKHMRVTAGVIAVENLSKPNIQMAIAEALPDEELLQTHKEGLRSNKVMFTPEGERIDVTDFSTRHKYLETAYKLKGLLKDGGTTNNTLNIITEAQQRAIAERILKGK